MPMKRAQMAIVPTMAPMMVMVWEEGWSGDGVEVDELDGVDRVDEEIVVVETVDVESVD
jgi:hypothetical protein